MGKIIAVANQKGGVGKTTTTVNLSAALAVSGKRVLLVDIDPQGNASTGAGVERGSIEASMYDVLVDGVPMSDIIRPGAVSGLSVAPSNIELAGAEVSLVSVIAREHVLESALKTVRGDYDFILIDCPPSLGLLTLNALTACESILIPIQCEYYALEGLTQLMSTIKLVKQRLNPALDIEGALLTMYDGRTNLGTQVADEVRKYFKSKVYQTVIPRNVRLSEAPSHGLPICAYDARSSGADAYRRLAEEFLRFN